MAAASKFYQHTCTGTVVNLSTVLGERHFPSAAAFRAGRDNVGAIYWGGASVSSTAAGGYLERGDAFVIDELRINTDEWNFIGTLNDVLHVTIVE
jgi:hypothetical protein